MKKKSSETNEATSIFPSYFDLDQISRLMSEDEQKGKAMFDLMFRAVHEYNKAQVEKEFPTRKPPF